jgi:hypothetical protein
MIDTVQDYLNFFFLMDFLLRLYATQNPKSFLTSTLVDIFDTHKCMHVHSQVFYT